MGTSVGGLIVRTPKGIDEVARLCFGETLARTSFCDTRQSNCFYFGRKEGLLIIANSDLSNKVFSQKIIDETLYNNLGRPAEIFAFEEYDSGACYGYAIFSNGTLIRKIRTENYGDVTDEFGEPLSEEQPWLNGQRTAGADGDGMIINVENGQEIDEVFLYREILQLLMTNRFSFTAESMHHGLVEEGHFLLNQNTDTISGKQGGKQWWKFWG